jgi:hypothetical protein
LRFDDESDTKWLNIYNYCVNIHIPWFGQCAEWDKTWEEIENHILEKSGNLLLDIPEFITNESYRTKFEKSRNIYRIEYKYPLAFVDNFRDLE